MLTKDMIFLQAAAACPTVKVADVRYNVEQIKSMIDQAYHAQVKLLVFPELCITTYTCGDLFFNAQLLIESTKALKKICDATNNKDMLIIVGCPLRYNSSLFNCGIFIKDGIILGIVPKSYIPNYNEFNEKRYFDSGLGLIDKKLDLFFQKDIPFGTNLILRSGAIQIACEICEDMWTTIPPSSFLTLSGANVICNLSASNELIGKADYRRQLINSQSEKCMCAYVYASAGVHESTSDLIFSGHSLICENGSIIAEGPLYARTSQLLQTTIDISKLEIERLKNTSFRYHKNMMPFEPNFIDFKFLDRGEEKFDRVVGKYPFVPHENIINERCLEILTMQSSALAKRLEHTQIKKVVLGISGGLDSTLALLAAIRTFEMLNIPRENILTLTLPGFGTTDRTYTNAVTLCQLLGTNFREINIVAACLQHFKDIGHDANILDVTYENVQARERTQILMDIANREGALLLGTGDLSELALGWCTYNGDHMSMYSINCSIPKTLIQYIIKYAAMVEENPQISQILLDVLDTPISPELLPKDEEGAMVQKTEDIVGPYALHDFFLYYFIKQGATPERILFFAKKAFSKDYEDPIIEKWLKVFLKRFFTQQFKRSCAPDGPKIGSVSLSPRGDWRMSSDVSYATWLTEE